MTDPVMQSVSPESSKKGSDRSLLLYTTLAIGAALIIRFFVASPWIVSGPSMEPTFENHDYLIVDRLTYDFESPQRGDIIVFKLPEDPSDDLIKRVIGLPGETVQLKGNSVIIFNQQNPQGFTLSEPYIDPADFGGITNVTVTLGPNQYFVLGDNRVVSADSRIWGTLPRSDIIGRVVIRLYPFDKIGVLPGEARYTS